MSNEIPSVHEFAQKDSPSHVNVPNTWAGLIAWGVIRYGTTILTAIVFFMAAKQFYLDFKEQNTVVMQALISQSTINAQTISALESMRKSIDDNRENWSREVSALKRLMEVQTDAIERARMRFGTYKKNEEEHNNQ